MKRGWQQFIFLLTVLSVIACQSTDKLPILGNREAVIRNENGLPVTDSVYHTIPDFAFVSQYGDTVTNHTLNGDRKSTRLNSSHSTLSRMPSSA